MKIGFDLISDLNLSPDDNIDWENKVTSLYCLIAGNVSHDLATVALTLNKLSQCYQGVFYVPGPLEFENAEHYPTRIKELMRICKKIKNLAFLHHHVVIIDGVAILGCTGYYGNEYEHEFEMAYGINKFDDLVYLKNSLEKLQKHLDVKKIIVLTSAVPDSNLYFGEIPKIAEHLPDLSIILESDSEQKIKHWAYGSYKKIVDTQINGINYICNPCDNNITYYAKRIDVEV